MEKNIRIGDKTYSLSSDDNYLDAMGSDFEPHMVQLFRALITPDDVVADIGANIGLTAILFSALARWVYAFEPSPSTFNILRNNLARAGATNVEMVNLGLGNKTDSLTITFAKSNRSGGYVSDKIRPEAGHISEEIRIQTLDSFFTRKQPPTFLKIDVEGFEQNVIKGGAAFLREYKPMVVMEMNHFCLDVLQRITIPDFLDFMRANFPYLYAIDTDNKTIVNLHVPDQAYVVMHEHVVKHRFPNIVGGFDTRTKEKLDGLASSAGSFASLERRLSRPAGKIIAQTSLQAVKASDYFEIPVSVFNEGVEAWHSYGNHPVLLSYHWKRKDGGNLICNGVRTELQNLELDPGNTVDQKIKVIAPNEMGDFRLILTLVQEGVCWFEDRGFKAAILDISVV